MMHLRTLAAAAALAMCAMGTTAQTTAVYNDTTGELTLPSVQVGSTLYGDVVVRLGGFSVQRVGTSMPAAPGTAASARCTPDNLTSATFGAIAPGMRLDEVKAVIGCPDVSALSVNTFYHVGRVWSDGDKRLIYVYFDPSGAAVQPTLGDHYKTSVGLSPAAAAQ